MVHLLLLLLLLLLRAPYVGDGFALRGKLARPEAPRHRAVPPPTRGWPNAPAHLRRITASPPAGGLRRFQRSRRSQEVTRAPTPGPRRDFPARQWERRSRDSSTQPRTADRKASRTCSFPAGEAYGAAVDPLDRLGSGGLFLEAVERTGTAVSGGGCHGTKRVTDALAGGLHTRPETPVWEFVASVAGAFLPSSRPTSRTAPRPSVSIASNSARRLTPRALGHRAPAIAFNLLPIRGRVIALATGGGVRIRLYDAGAGRVESRDPTAS